MAARSCRWMQRKKWLRWASPSALAGLLLAILAAALTGCIGTTGGLVTQPPPCLTKPCDHTSAPRTVTVEVRSNPNTGTIEFEPPVIHVCVGDIVRWHSNVGDPVVITFPATPDPLGLSTMTLGAFEQRETPVTGGQQACHDYGGKRGRKADLTASEAAGSTTSFAAARGDTTKSPLPGPMVIVDY